MHCKWLSEMFPYPDWNNFNCYENKLYQKFKNDIIEGRLIFLNKKINIRREPFYKGKEEIFYHITCSSINHSDMEDRSPSTDRMIRVPWIRDIIKNSPCQHNCCESKPILWKELFKNGNYRYQIYFNRYLIVIEERENYCLLITAFYVEKEYYHKGLLKRYRKAENADNIISASSESPPTRGS